MKSTKNKLWNTTKGQITIFIILGIVILFSIALVVYINSSVTKIRPPVEQLEVGDELKPVQNYVTACLSQVSKDALIHIGSTGGYNTLTNVKLSSQPWKSEALLFYPNQIPYWYYLDDSCTGESPYGCLASKKPPLCSAKTDCIIPDSRGDNSIEESLNIYVQDHLLECINGFSPFREQYDFTVGKMSVQSQVNAETVSFKLDYPITVTPKNTQKSAEIPYFYTEHAVKLKEIYVFASEITDAEKNYHFIESQVLNLITIYSGVDANLLPPTSGMELFTASKKYWVRTEVKSVLMDDVLSYLNFVQFATAGNANTIYAEGPNANLLPFADGVYRSMMVKPTNITHFDINANMVYQGWDIYLRIGDSEIIKPQSIDPGSDMALKLLNTFVNDYRFKYDLSHPILVRLEDPAAFNGEGYTFNIALESNIRGNVPIAGNVTVVGVASNPEIDLNAESQKINRVITLETRNKHTGEPLPGVQIYYRCGVQYFIGQTELESGRAILKQKFPYCPVGGEILYEKTGFLGSGIEYNNDDLSVQTQTTKSFDIELWPLKEKTIIVQKRTPANLAALQKPGSIALFSKESTNLTANESVFLNIARLQENIRDSDVPVVGFMMYRHSNSNTLTLTKDQQVDRIKKLLADNLINQTVYDNLIGDFDNAPDVVIQNSPAQNYTLEFVPGTYQLNAFMMYGGSIRIPAETRKICSGIKVFGDSCIGPTQELNLDGQQFDSWITGGATTAITLNEDDIYNSDTIIFYVLEMPLPQTWSDLEHYQSPESYQVGKEFLIKPRLQ